MQLQQQSSPGANNTIRLRPNLPRRYLLTGPLAKYLKSGVPLYEASIKCDWDAAEKILKAKPDLVRFSITGMGETALHVASSAKASKLAVVFVKNLVDMMKEEDLVLENENFSTALYLAAAAGNLEMVNIMVEKNRNLVTIPGAGGQMLPLYVAALFGYYKVVEYLFGKSKDLCDADGWNDMNRGWLLEKCVENDMLDIALEIVKMYPNLGSGNVLAILARKPEAFHESQSTLKGGFFKLGKYMLWRTINSVFALGGSKVKDFADESMALQLLRIIWEDIVKKPKFEIDRILRGPLDSNKQDKSAPGRAVLVMQLQELISQHLDEMNMSQDPINQDNKPISGKADQGLELQKLISENILNTHDEIQKINETVIGNQEALKVRRLQKVILDHIGNIKTESQKIMRRPVKNTYSSRIVFIAAEMGNTGFLIELIHQYPDLIWKVNDNNQTIFHIAVKHRNAGIYNLLHEIGAMKDMIVPLRDPKGNNILHLAGQRAKENRLKDVSGVALQMQRELLWFKEVRNMVPPLFRELRNKDGLTPHELFTNEHKDLVSKGEEWMKGTASQCMVVAALIATIVFAAAFTVPGGYNQDNGIPVFRSKATFIVFVVADAISLFSSCASIIIFLAILTSRYAERDFLESLPKKLMYGLLTLFLSITTMTVAFSVSFFVLYHKGLFWIPILIGVFAVLPVILYMLFQKSLFFDVFLSTFHTWYLFNPEKRVLYYENPKV
uniref:uncharacterized protein LOC122604632 n=1 Tax=Erigeron canadensis TaxID=72917 RepID=UPI001CB95E4C|nr:uncharacterized protein LOC122604632 [Erigeron canadensis]